MRSVRSTVLALLILGGAGVVHAQATQPAPDARTRREAMKPRRGPGRGEGALFRGIQLSESERASLKTIREKYQSQYQSLHDSFKPQRDEFRSARERGDTAAMKALRAKGAEQREKMGALWTQEQRELRAALTPEHQQQFDRNVAELKQRMDRREGKGFREGGERRFGPRGRYRGEK